ncbi:hypothetical protein K488DRAFT_60992 [Vararia minispora EC-137]|uniref:Uncharacterized protein n=1 Tax=Vararia minispora EC-137 TaxID=1314806 RepID=A0ACB8Q7C5_9AGAM|nr:hypothetical protein K488DRAFT_60992 [Vararia minispora EC-137]
MHSVLDAFKLQEFDIEPVLSSWTDAPRFLGDLSKDPPVDEWLDALKAGCQQREVPRDYWPKVGQALLGPRARKRFDELKAVLRQMHGGKYRWDWKKFKVAMRNMGWDIADDKAETVKVATRPSGSWWILGGNKRAEMDPPPVYTEEPEPMHAADKKQAPSEKDKDKKHATEDSAPSRQRKASKKGSIVITSDGATSVTVSPVQTPGEGASTPCLRLRYFTNLSGNTTVATTTASAPLWLLNACGALDFLNSEHPKAMSTIAAVLITVGSLPALPGLSAVAGGTVLTSHAIQAAGAIAVGVGNWLKSSQDAAARQQHPTPQESHAQIEQTPTGQQAGK